MAINLITRVEPKVMERLYKESVTQGLFSNNYSWAGAQTIEIMSVDNVPLTAYGRTANDGTAGTIGKRFGSIIELGDTKKAYTMQDVVKYNIGIDKVNSSDQENIKTASSVISRQDREIVRPYIDKYRLNKLALGAGLNKYSATTTSSGDMSKGKVVETLMTARAALANHLAPMGKQVLYIGETMAIQLKLADQVIGIDKIGEQPIANGVMNKIAGMQLNVVPDDYMPTVTSGSTTGHCLFLIVTKGSAWAPVKIMTSRVLDEHPDFYGPVVQFLGYHDCFVNDVRKDTIYACWDVAESVVHPTT